MTLKIISDKKNIPLDRRELEFVLDTKIAPKVSEVEEIVAKEFSTQAEKVKVRKIKGRFGSTEVVVTANIYSSKEEKDKVESKTKKEKKQKVAGAKK